MPPSLERTFVENLLVETIARALCQAEGRTPDHLIHGIPQWRRYEFPACVVARALEQRTADKGSR